MPGGGELLVIVLVATLVAAVLIGVMAIIDDDQIDEDFWS